MGAPNVTYRISKNKISAVSGFNSLSVTFSADGEYTSFECRATKAGEDWGVGVGNLIASFSQTPENTERTFEIYDDYLLSGDGDYRIGLYVEAPDGSWNDTIVATFGGEEMTTADGDTFFVRKGGVNGGV